ncbi:MAG TPA: VOC family protein [Rhodothermales bacterium]|nr:VOC family protein [Rhodothermales bacterium]
MHLAEHWHHCGIAVSDLDAAISWYEDNLGFRVEKRFRLPDAHLDIANLTSPSGARIELLQQETPTPSPNTGRDLLTPGAMHLCFEVDDVEALTAELKARNVQITQEPKIIAPAGVKNCWIADLEGNPIEFIEPLDRP